MKTIRIHFLFFLFLFLHSQLLTAQENPHPQYDLNDPRNPDCPCHKYQKLAEDEYARQNKIVQPVHDPEENKMNAVKENHVINNENTVEGKAQKMSTTTSSGRKKKKGDPAFISKWKFRFYKSKRGVKRVRTDYSTCFKF